MNRKLATLLGALVLLAGTTACRRVPPPRIVDDGGGWKLHKLPERLYGGHLHVRVGGRQDGPPLLLIHGVGEDAPSDWAPIVPLLAPHFRVILVHLPGFGQSIRKNRNYTPTGYAQVLSNLLRELKATPARVVGHSMGGAVALRLAARTPEVVERLALIDVAGLLYQSAFGSRMASAGIKSLKGMSPERRKEFEKEVYNKIDFIEWVLPSMDLVLRNRVTRRLFLGSKPSGIAGLAVMIEDFSEHLRQVEAPAALFWGREDQVAPLRSGRILSHALGAPLHVFDGVAHVPMKQAAERLAPVLMDWLRAEVPPPAPRRVRTGATIALPDAPAQKVIRCDAEPNVVLSGHYARIYAQGCEGLRLEDVTAEQIVLSGSTAKLRNVRVRHADTALLCEDSRVSGTAVSFEGGPQAIRAHDCRLDLAWASVRGEEAAVFSEDDTIVIFSLSELRSARGQRKIHDHVILGKGDQL